MCLLPLAGVDGGEVVKPPGPIARRGDYRVAACPHALAAALVADHHYARGAANTSVHSHGLFRRDDGQLVGAALWMPPTVKAARAVAGERWRGVLALSRLVVIEGEPANAASLLLGRSMRAVSRDDRWHLLVTWADTGRGHAGTIYRATGWAHDGLHRGGIAWIDPSTGRQVSLKAKRSRTVAEMLALGYQRARPSPKHRFIYRVRP